MIDSIIRYSIEHKLVIGLFVAGLIGWGVYSAQHLPIDAVPDITDNQVQVITYSPSLAAQEVEQFITFPLEMAMGNIPSVVEQRSVSRFGLSIITVVFEDDMDIYLARQLISERIQMAQSDIPEGLGSPEMGPISTGLGEIYQYVIRPAEGYEGKFSSTELRTLQDWVVKRQLIGIPGVIEVNSSGGYLKQYEVAVDPDKLRSMGVTMPDVFEAIEKNNENTGGSYIEKKHHTYFIRGEGLLENLDDIRQVVVKNVGGVPLLVKDVAEVRFGHAPRFGAVTMDGIGEVVAGHVMMLKGENSSEVTQRVKAKMPQIQASLPEGVVIEPYLDRMKLVNRTTKTVITNLVEGGLIVIFVLVLLLGNFRAGLVVASVIPLAMLFALGMMRVFGVSANLMSLGAIDFGLIVDGAVIIVESIVHRLGLRQTGMRLSQKEMDAAVYESSSRIRSSAAFGEIIILIVYLPILFLSGIEGKMFIPMAQTVSFAILGALILSLTYVPMASALFLSKKISTKITLADRIIHFLHRLYRPVLEFALRAKTPVMVAAVVVFGLSLWQFSRMGGEFIPTLEEGDFALHQILPPGSSLEQGVEVSAELQRILLEFPEVEKVVTKIGTSEIPFDLMPMEAGDIFVSLKPKDEWTTASDREGLFEKMEEKMSAFPGVTYEFTQPIQMRFNELMTGVRQDIAIKIYGEDLGQLLAKARQAEGIIQQIDGVGDLRVEAISGLQQMVVDYDRAKVAKYGLDIATLNRMVRGSFAGEVAGHIFEGEKRFDLVVRLAPDQRTDITDLQNLYVPLPGGGQIPLSQVAKIEYREGPTQISRDNTQRRITIGVNARNRDVESLVNDIRQQLADQLDLPTGYYLTFGGQFENLERARARLNIAVPVALALIFLLLYFTFSSVKQALLIFTAIPLSAIGGIWALEMRGMPFSISAGVGFIALFGVAVLNGIVLIAFFNQLKKEGMDDLTQRIRTGTQVRLRPVVMTAAVASLGFLPMALSNTAGAEVQRPLATVVIGGLITATLLTLIVLPVLYYFSEKGLGKRPPNAMLGALVVLFCSANLGAAQTHPNTNGKSVPPSAVTDLPSVLQLTLDGAIQSALQTHPALRRDQLHIEQQQALARAPNLPPPANVLLTGEEWDFSQNAGIHSVGVYQSFNLPKANKTQRELYGAQANLAAANLQLTEQQLKKTVSRAWYDVLHAKSYLALLQEKTAALEFGQRIAEVRFEVGETGRMPIYALNSRMAEHQLALEQAEWHLKISLAQLSGWVGEEVSSEQVPDTLPGIITADGGASVQAYSNFYAAQKTVAESQVQVAESQLLPQVNSGVQLQSVAGKVPFFGYQLGVNVPLFRKGYEARIEAAEIGVAAAEANLSAQAQVMAIEMTRLQQERNIASTQADGLVSKLLPEAHDQMRFAQRGYEAGEVTYLEYLDSLDYVQDARKQLLDWVKSYYFINTDIKFFTK